MANSSAATDTALPARGPDGVERQTGAPDYVDLGQPVDDLPPLEEFGFDEPAEGETAEAPPVKDEAAGEAAKVKAIAPGKPSAEDAPSPTNLTPPAQVAAPPLADIGPVEPAVASEPGRHGSASAARGVGRASMARWSKAAWLAGRRRRLAFAAAAAALFIGVAAVMAGVGAFSRGRDYRVAGVAPPPGDPAQRFAFYRAGAKSGDASSELQLAILYAKGEGVAQDYAAAATWFRAAADQGVARAQYDLGVLYERGRGVQVDLNEAAGWYLKAATGRYPLAEYNLAVCYTKGQGIRQDLPEAALWYRRAAGHGVVQAMINLGMMYEKGDGIAASPVDAYAWYLAAGQRGNPPAAQRAQELFASLPRLDQIRAEALASDVAASIHNPQPERGEAATEKPDAKPNAPDH